MRAVLLPIASAAIGALLTACSPGSTPSSHLPTLLTAPASRAGGNEQLTALLPNVTIAEQGHCVVAVSNENGRTRHVLVFPAGYKLKRATRDRPTAILDARGQIWAHLGEVRTLGGGEVPAPPAGALTRCAGPYWLVATHSVRSALAPKRPPPPPEL